MFFSPVIGTKFPELPKAYVKSRLEIFNLQAFSFEWMISPNPCIFSIFALFSFFSLVISGYFFPCMLWNQSYIFSFILMFVFFFARNHCFGSGVDDSPPPACGGGEGGRTEGPFATSLHYLGERYAVPCGAFATIQSRAQGPPPLWESPPQVARASLQLFFLPLSHRL